MSERIRAFIAVPVPDFPELREVCRELRDLGRIVRVTNPRQFHVTLKFLGEIGVAEVVELSRELGDALSMEKPGASVLAGLGAFPTPARPGIVWAGFQSPESWTSLASVVESVCTRLGHPTEDRPFHPHVTLARIKGRPPRGIAEILQAHADDVWGHVPIDAVELMESRLGAGGSQYQVLAKFPLGGNGFLPPGDVLGA